MSVTSKVIAQSQYIPATVGALYTATNRKAQINGVVVTNQDTSVRQFSLHFVESGGSAGSDNRTIPPRSLQPGESVSVYELIGQNLDAGDSIHGDADAASQVTIRISGVEIT